MSDNDYSLGKPSKKGRENTSKNIFGVPKPGELSQTKKKGKETAVKVTPFKGEAALQRAREALDRSNASKPAPASPTPQITPNLTKGGLGLNPLPKKVLPKISPLKPGSLPRTGGMGSYLGASVSEALGRSIIEDMFEKIETDTALQAMENQGLILPSNPRNDKGSRPCPRPSNRARDNSRCGGRSAESRGKTSGYDGWTKKR